MSKRRGERTNEQKVRKSYRRPDSGEWRGKVAVPKRQQDKVQETDEEFTPAELEDFTPAQLDEGFVPAEMDDFVLKPLPEIDAPPKKRRRKFGRQKK